MTDTMTFSLLAGILIILVMVVAITLLLRRINMPSILGYLVVGLVVGPHGLGFLPGSEDARELAEYGLMFLMFTIGLEFSLTKLIAMRQTVLVFGGLQVLISTIATVVISLLVGLTPHEAIVIGGIVAMSSTAIAMKQLTDQLEINSRHGMNAVGILLMQDIAVILFLILIPTLAGSEGHAITIPLLKALGKGAIAIGIIFAIGHWVLRPLFGEVARAHSRELFTLTVLLVVLSSAWISHVLGISIALGAFVAGIMLGETKYRHQIDVDIRPFRDVLLGLFFVTVGMMIDLEIILEAWPWILLLLAGLIIGKFLLIMLLALILKQDKVTAVRTGIVLAQGGEFGFAVLTLALANNMITPLYGQVALGALLISMTLAPVFIRFNKPIAAALLPRAVKIDVDEISTDAVQAAAKLKDHIIICGYGRVGQSIAHLLEQENIPFSVLDLDPARIQKGQVAGRHVIYGDATHDEMLEAAGVDRAKAVVLTYIDIHTACKTLEQIRREHPDLPVLVRSPDDSDLAELQECGATEVIPETLEASLTLVMHLLLSMNIPMKKVLRTIESARADRYSMLRYSFPEENEQ